MLTNQYLYIKWNCRTKQDKSFCGLRRRKTAADSEGVYQHDEPFRSNRFYTKNTEVSTEKGETALSQEIQDDVFFRSKVEARNLEMGARDREPVVLDRRQTVGFGRCWSICVVSS